MIPLKLQKDKRKELQIIAALFFLKYTIKLTDGNHRLYVQDILSVIFQISS